MYKLIRFIRISILIIVFINVTHSFALEALVSGTGISKNGNRWSRAFLHEGSCIEAIKVLDIKQNSNYREETTKNILGGVGLVATYEWNGNPVMWICHEVKE